MPLSLASFRLWYNPSPLIHTDFLSAEPKLSFHRPRFDVAIRFLLSSLSVRERKRKHPLTYLSSHLPLVSPTTSSLASEETGIQFVIL
jgi:hypothetical protein